MFVVDRGQHCCCFRSVVSAVYAHIHARTSRLRYVCTATTAAAAAVVGSEVMLCVVCSFIGS